MSSARTAVANFGTYTLTRAWFFLWRWRLAEQYGQQEGLHLSRAGAMFAARQRLREVGAAKRPLRPPP
jgi:hypothetical protein